MIWVLIALAGLALLLLVIRDLRYLFSKYKGVDLDLLDDDTYNQVMSNKEDWRNETLNEFLLRLYNWCDVKTEEDIEKLGCVVSSPDANLTTFRFYIDGGILTIDGNFYWSTNKFELRFTTDSHIDKSINWTKSKLFKFKNYRPDYVKVGKWFKKWLEYYEGYTAVRKSEIIQLLSMELKRTANLTPDKYIEHNVIYDAVLDILVYSDKKKHLRTDKNFISSLALLLKGVMESDERDKFLKYLKDQGILGAAEEDSPKADEPNAITEEGK